MAQRFANEWKNRESTTNPRLCAGKMNTATTAAGAWPTRDSSNYVQLMHEQTLGLDPQWNNGLYLAGEAMSWYGLSGWVDGAIKTGIQAAISAARKVIG